MSPGPQHKMSFRVDGKSRCQFGSTWICVEIQNAVKNIAELYHKSSSECVELALRAWLLQFPEEERLYGLKRVREKARLYDACVCTSEVPFQPPLDEISEKPAKHYTTTDVDKLLGTCGYKFFMTQEEVIAATGKTRREVQKLLEPLKLPAGLRYRRQDVANNVSPEVLESLVELTASDI